MSDSSDTNDENSETSFSEARRKALEEKGEGCYICDRPRDYSPHQDISVHHINGDDTDHRVENLLPVCQSCHKRIHRRDTGPYKKWHEMLPDSKQLTKDDLNELYKQRDAERQIGENIVLSVSTQAQSELPVDVDTKIELPTEEAAEELIEQWSQQLSSANLYLQKAHPGMADTEVTHSVVCRQKDCDD